MNPEIKEALERIKNGEKPEDVVRYVPKSYATTRPFAEEVNSVLASLVTPEKFIAEWQSRNCKGVLVEEELKATLKRKLPQLAGAVVSLVKESKASLAVKLRPAKDSDFHVGNIVYIDGVPWKVIKGFYTRGDSDKAVDFKSSTGTVMTTSPALANHYGKTTFQVSK